MRFGPRQSPIGISFDGPFVRAAQLVWTKSAWRIGAATQIPGASADDLAGPGRFGEIKDVLTRQGFLGRRLVVGLKTQQMLTAVLDVPPRSSGAPVDDIARAELAGMHGQDPDAIEAVCWDLPSSGNGPGASQAMAMACPHAVAEPLLASFEAVGFDVVALDSELQARVRASHDRLAPDGVTVLLELGWGAADLCMTFCGNVVYHRSMDEFGIGSKVQELARTLGLTLETLDYALSGSAASNGAGHGPAALLETIETMLEGYWSHVAAELHTPLNYVRRQYPDAPLSQMLLTGYGASAVGAAQRFSEYLNLPADVAAADTAGPALAAAVGLARFGLDAS